MSNKIPFFSIVIPTRNRHETLAYTIKTILKQSFIDYELIICDNNSSQETKEVVQSFKNTNIKYIRSNTSLAMVKNWELALSHAKGKYVTVLADNDGFIDNSLAFIYKLLKYNYFPNILRWEKNTYQWPDIETQDKNTMLLHAKTSLKELSSKKIIKKVIEGDMKFQKLPMIYNSFISMKLIQKLKNINGKVFNSLSPDVYSGFAFAYLNKSYLSLDLAITIGANSSKSNGMNSLKKNSSVTQEFMTLNTDAQIIFHPKVPLIKSSLIVAICDSFLRAQEDLDIKNNILNRKDMIKRMINSVLLYSNDDRVNFTSRLLESTKDNQKLQKSVQKTLEDSVLKISTERTSSKPSQGFSRSTLILDGDKYGINNIDDVSNFMANYYNYSLSSVNLPEISKRLQEIPKNAHIAIWGRGESSSSLQKNIKKYRKDIKIKYIVDSFFENLTVTPKVIQPSKIKNVKYIIIASMYVQSIKKSFDDLNLKKSISLYRYIR